MNDYKLSDMGIKCPISFDSVDHIYRLKDTGEILTSVSKVLSSFCEPFDSYGVSAAMAKGNKAEQKKILKEWEKSKNDSIDHGNNIHEALEYYGNYGTHPVSAFEDLGKQVANIIGPYYKSFQELIVWHIGSMIAGTADRPVLRTRGSKAMLDVYDYKTNLKKGIEYNSSYFNKSGEYKHLKKFFYDPVSHLEDCNYNKYALQLSIYAYMISVLFGVVVGQLGIIFVEQIPGPTIKYVARLIPVPYLFHDARNIVESFKPLKPLPQKIESKVIGQPKKEVKTEIFIDEDW